MDGFDLVGKLRKCPIIAAVKSEQHLPLALDSSCTVIFLLKGNICNIEKMVKEIHSVKKHVFVHIDLIDGFSKDKYSLQFVKERVVPDGIITTKSNLTKAAKDLSIPVIQRVFLIDNLSLESGIESIKQSIPNAVEILPGIMPFVTRKICKELSIPIITGGLVNEESDITNSLEAGAVGVSTSTPKMWECVKKFKL